MQGKITTYDKRKGEGRVQGEDGHIYRFKRDDIAKEEDLPYLAMDMQVEFNTAQINGYLTAQDLSLVDIKQFDNLNLRYNEPESFYCSQDDLVDGYDILDRALYPIYRSERTEEKAFIRLKRECEALGANGVVSYRVDKKLKGAFGNGFYLYTAKGVPVVMGIRCDNGELNIEALKHRIDQVKVKKNHQAITNTRIGMLVIKALGAVLLFIFAMGFILTGGI